MQLIINILVSFSLYLVIAVSYSIIYYITKIFHLAHAAVITFGAYFLFYFNHTLGIPLIIAAIIAIIFSVLIGMACDFFIYRKMRKRDTPLLVFLIASLGLYIVLQNIISIVFGDDNKILNTSVVSVGKEFLGAYITNIQIAILLISTSIFVLVNLFLKFTSLGRAIRAVSSNSELSNIYGIPANRIILIVFGISSAVAAIAGMLSAMETNMNPTFGFNLLLYGIVAMIIGGVGSMWGLIGGAMLLASAQHIATYYIGSQWTNTITYVILIAFLLWKPLGF
ncbi:MAG: branched-chain amino acid ABC transporter permease, partial [Bacillus cereus]|nr:branched-chain amino acid ABC transporter permease [Bacillus cereus]